MAIFKSILILFSFPFFTCSILGQVTEVLYKMEYNQSTQLYDCKIVINKGNATSIIERVQLNSQYSVVVPTGSSVSLVKSLMPLQDNQNLQGTEAVEWYLASTIPHPTAQPASDYYGIIPRLSPIGYYNPIQEGEEITLFSLEILSDDICDRNVRLYNVDTDPLSSSPGMMGGDFRNGISIGGPSQLYIGNQAPAEGMRAIMADIEICNGDCIYLAPEIECLAFPLTYEWSTGEQTSAIEICPEEATVYAVTITDGNGETSVIESLAEVINDASSGCNGISTATVEEGSQVIISPNPAADAVQFESSSIQKRITLVDVVGRVLAVQEQVSAGFFEVSHLSEGFYYLVLDDGTNISTERFVKSAF